MNAELIKQKKHYHYKNNRENILSKKNSYVVCDCGVSYTYSCHPYNNIWMILLKSITNYIIFLQLINFKNT